MNIMSRGSFSSTMNNDQYIHFGCGFCAPKSWRNFDASLTARFERIPIIGKLYTKNKSRFPENVEYGNIVKGLPIQRSTATLVYCSHILEHLSREDFRKALKNVYSLLKEEGIFRFVLPDLEYLAREYINDFQPDAALKFMKNTRLGQEKRLGLKGIIFAWLGNNQHLWMWDYRSIAQELKSAGFRDIRRAQLGDFSNELFNEVEGKGQWEKCIGVECRK